MNHIKIKIMESHPNFYALNVPKLPNIINGFIRELNVLELIQKSQEAFGLSFSHQQETSFREKILPLLELSKFLF